MTAELYISSDAPDTDFVVRVTDVDENGRSIKLADGLLSARYRNGFARSEFLQEGEIVCLKIRTTKLSNCFRKGHRIRVTVTSSAKNFIFPNSNTREGFASARTVVAHNRVYHGGLHSLPPDGAGGTLSGLPSLSAEANRSHSAPQPSSLGQKRPGLFWFQGNTA